MKILAIDTSCDETAAAVTSGRQVLSNVVYSQILMHQEWGGVVPSLARRGHQEKIDFVISEALRKAKTKIEDIDFIAVTYGPGLAIALEVGIAKAVECANKYNKKIIPVNHMEGHLYSSFVQNSQGNPDRTFQFPYLGLLISGAHTEIILFKDHVTYEILGETLDDAAGESFDKAARMLGFSYPGGPVIERLAKEVSNIDKYRFPRPMWKNESLDFSFSGLKTAFLYFTRNMSEEEKVKEMRFLASSFQEAVFQSILKKMEMAIKQTGVNRLLLGGGVAVNQRIRHQLRTLAKKHGGHLYTPPFKYLNFDNAAMIGVAAYFRAEKGLVFSPDQKIDRVPRLSLLQSTIS